MVAGILVYLSIGSVIWLVLDGLGVITDGFAKNQSRPGALVLATLFMITAWPLFIYLWLKGMARPAR